MSRATIQEMNGYDDFGKGSAASPFGLARTAHPGAVLLSPQYANVPGSSGSASSPGPAPTSAPLHTQAHNSGNAIHAPLAHHQSSLHQGSFSDLFQDSIPSGVASPPPSSASQPMPSIRTAGSVLSSVAANHSISGDINQPGRSSPNGNNSHHMKCSNKSNNNPGTSVYSSHFSGMFCTGLASPQSEQYLGSVPDRKTPLLSVETSGGLNFQQRLKSNESSAVMNFTQDINQLCSWMAMLSTSQQNTVMDNLLSSLNDEVLQHTKLKIDSLTSSGYLTTTMHSNPADSAKVNNKNGEAKQRPVTTQNGSIVMNNMDSMFVSNNSNIGNGIMANNKWKTSNPVDNAQIYDLATLYSQHWSPQQTSASPMVYDYLKDFRQRPKSAEPRSLNQKPSLNAKLKRGSPDIGSGSSSSSTTTTTTTTNSTTTHSVSIGNNSNPVLSTASKKQFRSRRDSTDSGDSKINRPSANKLKNKDEYYQHNNDSTGSFLNNNSSGKGTPLSSSSSMNPKSLTDPKLLTNLPLWLKNLRLHKYSDALYNENWEELIYMDDTALENKGVSALGARRKLLKAFAIVQDYKERDLIDSKAFVNSQ